MLWLPVNAVLQISLSCGLRKLLPDLRQSLFISFLSSLFIIFFVILFTKLYVIASVSVFSALDDFAYFCEILKENQTIATPYFLSYVSYR
jgi:hypothetical protein